MGVCCSVMDGACFFLLCLSSDGVDGVVGFFFLGCLCWRKIQSDIECF